MKPCPGCGREIEDRNFACFVDWRVLPKGLRAKISKQRAVTGDDNHPNVLVQLDKALRVWAELDGDD